MTSPNWLPPEVIAAIEAGQAIEAIKLLRQSTGMGLVEAKEAVDAYVRMQKAPEVTSAPGTSPVADPLAEVMQALSNGNKIEAVRLIREQRGLSLRDAKQVVDLMEANEQPVPRANPAPEAPRRSSTLVSIAVLLILIAAYAVYLLWFGE